MQDHSDLLIAYAIFSENHTFTPGMVVEWKPNMQNKSIGGPFVVLEVLTKPNLNPHARANNTYFREPLDLILGSYTEDGSFIQYHFDSRRFQPVA